MYYKDNENSRKTPRWADFFIDLGSYIAAKPLECTRSVTALFLPTRAFSTPFVAAGIIKSHAKNESLKSNDDHFQFLMDLPENTFVRCLDGKRQKTFKLKGTAEMYGETRLVIQMSDPRDGNARRYISKDYCHEIQFMEQDTTAGISLKSLKRQKGKSINKISKFAQEFLGTSIKTDFNLLSKEYCLIVGNQITLKREICETNFKMNMADKEFGVLQDVLRVKQFFTTVQPSRCEIINPSLRYKSVKNLSNKKAPVVVYDGANGFLRLRDALSTSHWIILLDRTEPNSLRALEILNQAFTRREPDTNLKDFPGIPLGVEAMFFEEKIN